MDEKMAKNALELLSYTPSLFLLNSYWMLSNRQMFDNVVNKIAYTTDEMRSAHSLLTMFELNQATPLLVISCAIVLIGLLRIFCYQKLQSLGFAFTSKVFTVDEKLPNFFHSIKLSD